MPRGNTAALPGRPGESAQVVVCLAVEVADDGAGPILVIGNTGDPATPYEGAKKMADELGEGVGVHVTVDGEGHCAYGVNGCLTGLVDKYLLDGTVPENDTICL